MRATETGKAAEQHSASVAELTGLNEKLAADKATLENQLAQARTTTEQARVELTELRTRVTAGDQAMQRQIAASNDAVAAGEKLQAQIKDLGSQLAAVRAENTRLASATESGAALRTELNGIKKQFADATKAAEQHAASVAELTGLNEKLATDKAALERQVTQTRQTSEQTLAEVADLRSKVIASNRALEQQLTSVNEAAAAGEKAQAQIRELSAQIAGLRTENSRLGSATETASAQRAELADLKAKLAEAQKTAEQQGARVTELLGSNDKFGTSLKDLETQVAALRAENARLAQAEQGKQDAERQVATLSAAAAQLAAAQRDLVATRAENARLADSLQAVERDRVTRIAQLQQENSAVAARLRQAQGTLDSIASAARLINGGAVAPVVSSTPTGTPTITTAPAPARTHVVQEGDSLTRISSRYYGTTGRWQEIYEANREVLKGENALRPGQRLKIP
jgi:chromosome segregation ATPase